MLEYKTQPIEDCELKWHDDDWAVTGYATVWDSTDLAGDTVKRGAFEESLKSAMPQMRFEHLRYATIGKWDKAYEDDRGLKVEGHLTRDHSLAKDLRASLRHGTIRGLSQGFHVKPGGAENKPEGGRILKSLGLVEVSFTASPCEPLAVVESFKSEVAGLATLADMEDFLRDVGNLSKSMTTTLVSHMKTLCRSDSGRQPEEMKELISLMTAVQSLKKLIK
jgi:HK97 family phage prohead protease